MAQPKKKYKVVFRSGKPAIKIVLLCMIVACTVALIAIGIAIGNSRDLLENSTGQALDNQNEGKELQESINDQQNGEAVPDGYVDPDTQIIIPQ